MEDAHMSPIPIAVMQKNLFCCADATPITLISDSRQSASSIYNHSIETGTESTTESLHPANILRLHGFQASISSSTDERRAGSRENIARALATSKYVYSVNLIPASTQGSGNEVFNRYFVASCERRDFWVEIHAADFLGVRGRSMHEGRRHEMVCAVGFDCAEHGGERGEGRRRVVLWRNGACGKNIMEEALQIPDRKWRRVGGGMV